MLHVVVVFFALQISICAGIRVSARRVWLQIAIALGICILGVLFVSVAVVALRLIRSVWRCALLNAKG